MYGIAGENTSSSHLYVLYILGVGVYNLGKGGAALRPHGEEDGHVSGVHTCSRAPLLSGCEIPTGD